jgi:ribosomal protein S18 acetylase RimI-like enzyme
MSDQPIEVRPGTPEDHDYVRRNLTDAFGAVHVAGHDELIDASALPAGIARRGGERLGLVTYRADATGGWEVVTLSVDRPGQGVGRLLLEWVRDRAEKARVSRLWLVTTNDNTHALRFYQRFGFDLAGLDRGAVDRARRLKPSIPTHADGIPVRHELELELSLRDRRGESADGR